MASRPIWRGHLRLALVSCPVALYNARHDRASIRFNMINPDTGNRIKMVTQDSETGQELQRGNLVKGYEFAKNRYLILKDEDFDSVKVESSAVMSVEKFVDASSIDPMYYDASYYMAPDGKAGEDGCRADGSHPLRGPGPEQLARPVRGCSAAEDRSRDGRLGDTAHQAAIRPV